MSQINLNLNLKNLRESVEYITGQVGGLKKIVLTEAAYSVLRDEYMFDIANNEAFIIHHVEITKE